LNELVLAYETSIAAWFGLSWIIKHLAMCTTYEEG